MLKKLQAGVESQVSGYEKKLVDKEEDMKQVRIGLDCLELISLFLLFIVLGYSLCYEIYDFFRSLPLCI